MPRFAPCHCCSRTSLSFLLLLIGGLTRVIPAAEPVFQADGSMVCGPLKLDLDSGGTILVSAEDGGRQTIHLSQGWRARPNSWFTAGNLTDREIKLDPAGRSKFLTGKLPGATPEECVPITWGYALRDDGKVRVSLVYQTERPIQELLALANIHSHTPRGQLAGGEAQVDDQHLPLPVAAGAEHGRSLFSGQARQIALLSAHQAGGLVYQPATVDHIELKDQNVTIRPPVIELCFFPRDNRVEFDLDFSRLPVRVASDETYGGVDFWAAGRLRLPRYGLCRNLVQNPGFEEDFHYWQDDTLGRMTESRLGEYYEITTENPYRGQRCVCLRGEKDQNPAGVSTFAIPVETGRAYTVSFYAKGDRKGRVLNLCTRTSDWPIFPIQKNFALTTDWQRYSVGLTAPNGVLTLAFALPKPAEDCQAWLDAVQLEAGDLTEYTEKPLAVALLTAERNNCVEPGQKFSARLRLSGEPQARGEVKIQVTDLFGQPVGAHPQPFALDAQGSAELPLEWAEELGNGLFILETEYKLAAGFAGRDYFRLARFPFLHQQHKHKRLFAVGFGDSRQGGWERRLAHWERAGMGSFVDFGNIHPPQFLQLLAAHDIAPLVSIFQHSEKIGERNLKDDFELDEAGLAEVERYARETAAAHPQITHWKTINEPGWKYQSDPETMKKFVRMLAATARGIRAGNPQAIILSPDPANMYRGAGIRWMDTFLNAGGRDVCDIIGIHPYRPRPEEPDLDADTAEFLKMLAGHGYTGDVWFSEGIYHQNYQLPAYNLNVHAACSTDHFRAGTFSYHLGWGEKVCAAYTARSWLVGLKYGDRIKMQVDWGYHRNSRLDLDGLPGAALFASNTLGNLLGDSSFLRDVGLGEFIRCYVFADAHGRTVAALWNYRPDVDQGQAEGDALEFSGLPAGTELIGLDGAAKEFVGRLQLGPSPCFLRAPDADREKFLAALLAGRVVSGNASIWRAGVKFLSPQAAELTVDNLLSRPLNGKLSVTVDGESQFAEAVELPAAESWRRNLTVPPPGAGLQPLTIELKFAPEGQNAELHETLTLERLLVHPAPVAPKIDGDLSDWPATSRLEQPHRLKTWAPSRKEQAQYPTPLVWRDASDLSADLYLAWDREFLYVGLRVRDDRFDPAAAGTPAWQGDSVQIYFDGWGDARTRRAKGYGSDDQSLTVWPDPAGAKVIRDLAPEQQLGFLKTGPAPAVQVACRRNEQTRETVYELAFPRSEIPPVNLQAGGSFGFAVLINDRDGDYRKQGLTLTPAGTEPFMRPDLYPLLMLVE